MAWRLLLEGAGPIASRIGARGDADPSRTGIMGSNGYVSTSGATARLRDLDVVANNLANVGTPGFKRSESIFRAVLEASLRDAAGRPQAGAPATAFVSTDLVGTDFASGSAEHTGSPLHAMIEGPGFFEVEAETGLRYTRAGNFSVNRLGQLALPSGEAVQGNEGPIAIPDGFARIEPGGEILDANGGLLGRLKVVEFDDVQSLQREGQSLFRAPEDADSEVVDQPRFTPMSVEGSNVQAADELAILVMLQRAFETNLRAMQVDDESTQRLIEGIR